MIRPRTLMGIAVVASGLGLAACSSGTNTASSTTTTKASSGSTTSTSITTTGGADPTSAFCKDLAAASPKESQLSAALTSAIDSKNLAKVKTAFGPFITESQSELQKATAAAPTAPAAVKSAFKTVTGFYTQVRAKVSSATSLTTLQNDITTLSNSKAITDAGNTISGYVTAQCGTASTTSST
ncbi:MAG TPA: hypothetical protein VG412_04380 [Acidimicrobiales bacterium]|nr:hypothetical protein [Acidimicrobiales bacterium]